MKPGWSTACANGTRLIAPTEASLSLLDGAVLVICNSCSFLKTLNIAAVLPDDLLGLHARFLPMCILAMRSLTPPILADWPLFKGED